MLYGNTSFLKFVALFLLYLICIPCMWINNSKAADRNSVKVPVMTGDLVVDGKQLTGLLSLARHLTEEKQAEFVDEIRPIIDVGIIVENQDAQIEDDGYAFVHWSYGHIEPRHRKELVRMDNLDSFIEQTLIWHL